MSLELLDARPEDISLPAAINSLIAQAWDEIRLFMAKRRDQPAKGFQPSDFEDAYRWLKLVRSHFPIQRPPRFCEWGSGFGVVSVLAERLGFNVTAIESDQQLFNAGKKWQRSVGSEIRACHGSFIPSDKIGLLEDEFRKGLLSSRADDSESMRLDLDCDSVFDDSGFKPDSFDVIYAYPWPGEKHFLFRLFELVAKPGTLLLSFHGAADFRLQKSMQKRTGKK